MRIYSRAEWGARHPDGFRAAPAATEVWLHHSATVAPAAAATEAEDMAAVRMLEQIGQDRFGGGISYTFAVLPSGRVAHGHSVDREGAHTKGHNSVGRGICLVGDYDRHQPGPQMVAAVAELLAHGHRAGWWPAPRLTGGHRDVSATACPGTHAYALIGDINSRAADPQPVNAAALPTLRFGERGAAVRRLQEFLAAEFGDVNRYQPTGYYGDLTRRGLAAVQAFAGVTGPDADGTIVGPRTNAALASYGYKG